MQSRDIKIHSRELFAETNRISAVPLDPRYQFIWKNYELEQSAFWTHKKISFAEDVKHFHNAPEDIQESTLKVLGYFAGSDEIVEDIINKSQLCKITNPEIKYTLQYEAMMENIHSTVYGNNISAYTMNDAARRENLFRAVETMPSVAAKAEWARQWITDSRHIDYTLIGKACVEGINFSSAFAWIDWLKTEKYLLTGMYTANDEISRDENSHVMTSTIIHDLIEDTMTPDNAREIIDGSVEVEIQFVRDVISPRGYMGMSQNLMIEHVRHCAAILARDLGYNNLYTNTACPFWFMKKRSLNSKTNFFEGPETQYQSTDGDDSDSDDDSDPYKDVSNYQDVIELRKLDDLI
jgi:ribonucleotide reductase beta subunit family protein with ferritin-like domain